MYTAFKIKPKVVELIFTKKTANPHLLVFNMMQISSIMEFQMHWEAIQTDLHQKELLWFKWNKIEIINEKSDNYEEWNDYEKNVVKGEEITFK